MPACIMLQEQLNKVVCCGKNPKTSFLFCFRSFTILIVTTQASRSSLRRKSDMMSLSLERNEEAICNSNTDMPILRDIINELRESAASCAQTSNASLPNEDFLIKEALVLSAEDFHNTDETDVSTENTSDTILDALISSGKRISFALNDASPAINVNSEEQIVDGTIALSQVDSVQPYVDSSAVRTTQQALTKKQHIMISYNRSSESTCRQIRNHLRKLKYKVWMDVYDMHGNFIDGMAKAIRNSYIVLMCINREYHNSFWCRKEAEDIAIKRIKFIPCFMEEPFPLKDWLDFIVGANVWIDFSKADEFDDSLKKLIQEITIIEEQLATNPRETPPNTPPNNQLEIIISNPTMATFDLILGNFKSWIEENRDDLKRLNRKQSEQLINQLTKALQSDHNTFVDQHKKEFIQQLLLSTSDDQNEGFTRLINSSITSKHPMIKGLICIMALWAVRVVFQKK